MGNLHRGERVGVDTAAGAFPLHALSYLILGDEMSPMAPSGRPFVPQLVRTPAYGDDLGGIVQPREAMSLP